MQIDFHHGVTYVLARLSGFQHKEAEIVAYCAQYVDDATNSGTIMFDNGALYSRISSAHKMIDYRNTVQLENHHVWLPFHFLPGNGGKPAGENPTGTFIEKIRCNPNSHIARDMVKACIDDKNTLYGLHRLGITMHVFADTWAHQGFAGVVHPTNKVEIVTDGPQDESFWGKVKQFIMKIVVFFTGDVLPLGHGSALTNPDQPYLQWKYRRNGAIVERDNTSDFIEASDEMCKAMRRFQAGNANADVAGLTKDQKSLLRNKFESIRDESGEDRHKKWLDAIAKGELGFPPIQLEYKDKGIGSWKHQAIGTEKLFDTPTDRYSYNHSFLSSNWKLFHDALIAHRFTVIHDILPKYGICAA